MFIRKTTPSCHISWSGIVLGPGLGAVVILALMIAVECAAMKQDEKRGTGMQVHSNHLKNEKSPYLLQHVHNPVDWYPWGEDAFKRARREDKPIFLSIGYSTCHWCHVMARESFENEEIAALLNRYFVCVKVDREERPDVDQMYMEASMAMNGSGGWPLSVFLFPDGRPFYAATYIPARSVYGRPGFPDIIEAVHNAWQTRRGELEKSASGLIHALSEQQTPKGGRIHADVADYAFSEFASMYDQDHGGFGRAPKFPRPAVLDFLFQYFIRTGNRHALNISLHTLQAMAAGGVYDHLGGGFHRYSVDREWRVPHFEKMLYDQAQLLNSYLDALQITGDSSYGQVAREVAEYVLRDMRDPDGGFYSAEDADSEDPSSPGSHGEGTFYLWTEEEIVKTLGAEAANIFNYCYGIRFDGNAPHDPQQEFTGRNILYRAHTTAEAARHFNMSTEAVDTSLQQSRRILFARRQKRVRPHRDDKIITAWNGLMIGALARAGAVLDEQRMIEAAARAADCIRARLYDSDSGHLYRRYREKEAAHAGQLDDYAYLVAGLLELYKVEQDPELLQWAMDLTTTTVELFWDRQGGGFFDAVRDEKVPLRLKADYDGAEPAANSVAAMNLLHLGRLTGNDDWIARAEKTLAAFAGRINESPQALPRMLCALQQAYDKPEQVVIAGQKGDRDTRAMLAEIYRNFHPGQLVFLADGGENQQFLMKMHPFIAKMTRLENKATAYVCRDFRCRLPVTSVRELADLLREKDKKDL